MYISKSLSKFLCQFTIVIATERKGKKKRWRQHFGFWVRVCSWFLQKISRCVVFQRHLFLRGGELRATRECFKPRVTIAIGMLSLGLKCGWNPTELTSGFTLVTYLVKIQISGPFRLLDRERERESVGVVCVCFFYLQNFIKFWSEKCDFDLYKKAFSIKKMVQIHIFRQNKFGITHFLW